MIIAVVGRLRSMRRSRFRRPARSQNCCMRGVVGRGSTHLDSADEVGGTLLCRRGCRSASRLEPDHRGGHQDRRAPRAVGRLGLRSRCQTRRHAPDNLPVLLDNGGDALCRVRGRTQRLDRPHPAFVQRDNLPTDLLVEAIAYLIERLPHEPLRALLLQTEQGPAIGLPNGVVGSNSPPRVMLEHTSVDWTALVYRGRAMDDLVEYILRLIHSMVVAPPSPPRSGKKLKTYLRRWIAPVLAAHTEGDRRRRAVTPTARHTGRCDSGATATRP